MFAIPLLLSLLLPADDKPTPKLPLGKDTTYITEPLDKDGYLDYEAALNDRLGKGITPEKNANVLIWKAIGPQPEGGDGMPAEFFKRLGMDEPPEKGEYFIGLGTSLTPQLKLNQGEVEVIFDQETWAAKRPWSTKDYPYIADWLKANEKALALVVEATKRPKYFNPLVSRPTEKGPGSLIGAAIPNVQKCRGLADALACRAMLRVGEGNFDAAWQDLLACHRLGRLVGRGATLIEGLVGVAINQLATNADLAYLERLGPTAKQVQAHLKDLEGLPPIAPLAEKIDVGERFVFLDSVQGIRRGGLGSLKALAGGAAPKIADAEAENAMAKFDWEPLLRKGNQWYDRMVAATRLKDRADREKEFDKIDAELKMLKKSAADAAKVAAKLAEGKDPGKEASKAIGDVLISLFMPALQKVQSAYDRSEQVHRNLRLAFALAAYRSDNGHYPAKLEDLAPKYLPAVPNDLFSGKPLTYLPSDNGYLFYSVGVNGKDEDGRSFDDDPVGDDLPVRMPLPERKPKK